MIIRKKIVAIACILPFVFTAPIHKKQIKTQGEMQGKQIPTSIENKSDNEIFKKMIEEKRRNIEFEKVRQQAIKRIDKQIKKHDEEQKRKESLQDDTQEINLICTFYTGEASENGGYVNKTASGKTLSRGMCASNAHKFGTKIYTKEFNVLTVEDRGDGKYIGQVNENTYRIDIYVESKALAKKLGVMKIKGKIIK
jgi:3D (Asp-Asp-Asp) domain-containing protein